MTFTFFTVLLFKLFKTRADCRRFNTQRPTRRDATVSSRRRRRCELGITAGYERTVFMID